MFGPTPGPLGLTMMLPDAEPSGFFWLGPTGRRFRQRRKLGAPNFTFPVNGDPSLTATEKAPTVARFAVVSGTSGVFGFTVITGLGGGGFLIVTMPAHDPYRGSD